MLKDLENTAYEEQKNELGLLSLKEKLLEGRDRYSLQVH